MTERKLVSMRMDVEVWRRVRVESLRGGVTVAEWVERVLRERLEAREPRAGGLVGSPVRAGAEWVRRAMMEPSPPVEEMVAEPVRELVAERDEWSQEER